MEAPAEEAGLSPEAQTSSMEELTEEASHQIVDSNGPDSQHHVLNQTVSQPVCNRCSVDITGRSVTALGYEWHPNCFQCYVSAAIQFSGKLELI